MSEPRTHLDQRFSEPSASALTWDETRARIAQAELFWITTVRADGRPHVTPLVAVWHDGALHFCTGAEEQKALNLAANPNVALTTGTNAWNAGVDIVVEGRAEKVTDRDQLTALAAAWQRKWDGRWTFGAGEGGFTHDPATAATSPRCMPCSPPGRSPSARHRRHTRRTSSPEPRPLGQLTQARPDGCRRSDVPAAARRSSPATNSPNYSVSAPRSDAMRRSHRGRSIRPTAAAGSSPASHRLPAAPRPEPTFARGRRLRRNRPR